jgi:hypothetical protein
VPNYRIHRLKDTPREQFRWAAHTGGLAVVKLKDYEEDGVIEASNPYAAWKSLQANSRPLRPGDLLAVSNNSGQEIELHIAKYIGFEPAQWFAPSSAPEPSFPSGNTPSDPPQASAS